MDFLDRTDKSARLFRIDRIAHTNTYRNMCHIPLAWGKSEKEQHTKTQIIESKWERRKKKTKRNIVIETISSLITSLLIYMCFYTLGRFIEFGVHDSTRAFNAQYSNASIPFPIPFSSLYNIHTQLLRFYLSDFNFVIYFAIPPVAVLWMCSFSSRFFVLLSSLFISIITLHWKMFAFLGPCWSFWHTLCLLWIHSF